MTSLFGDQRILLVGGPGGVGKTTLAAALGVHLAESGYRTLVLTVDPAQRLAQALGFKGFSLDLQEVALPDGTKGGKLHASMLDTQRYFDRIIDRFARSPEQKKKILSNPLYQTMVDNLGGTHEYAAMERLFEFASDPRFERIVVDTPPTQNAVDLLSAPQRLADFMDNSVLKWFQSSSPYYLKLFKSGTKLAMKVLQKIFGAEFLSAFAEFMNDLEGMQSGFRHRNLEIMKLLKSPDSAFLLVNFPSEGRFAESVAFSKTLASHEIKLSGLILNRVEPRSPSPKPEYDPVVRQWLDYQNGLQSEQERWVDSFQKHFNDLPCRILERSSENLHDVVALSHLAQHLVS